MALNDASNIRIADFTTAGAWQFNEQFNVNAATGNVVVESISGNIDIRSNATGMRAQLEGYDVQLSAHNTFAVGVDAGAGMSIDAAANFSFGSGTGNFLLGALNGTVTIAAGQGFTMTADNNNISMTATLGDISLIAGGNITIIGILPGSPPVGSVPVMWDPVSKMFYHT